jgi:hypothetical protein
MNRKQPQPLRIIQENGKNITVLQKGLNNSSIQIIKKPAPPSPAPPPKVK